MLNFTENNWIEIVGAIAGLIYLYYEYKADIKMWPTGIVMSSFYCFVFFHAKFYAFVCINIYYIFAGIYGWIKWNKSKNQQEEAIVLLNTPKRYYLRISIITILAFAIISYLLNNYTDSTVVYGDSFVTTLSIVAMWMLAQRFVEQWLPLIVVNVVSVFLYFLQDLYPTSFMYLVYAIVSVFGYLRWKKLSKI